jgi:hypothetical protein
VRRRKLDLSTSARWRKIRWESLRGEQSLLLQLLRERLGTRHAMRIREVRTHDTDPGVLPHQFIDVEFGSYRLEFYRPMSDQGLFGHLSINTVDGRPLYGVLVPDR